MPRAVLLEHELPDGSMHFDWMIEDPAIDAERRLVTWRVGVRPDTEPRFEGERIGDHRACYLDHEGAIEGGRGSVRRIASADVGSFEHGDTAATLTLRWEGGEPVRYRGACVGGVRWAFVGSTTLDGGPVSW